MVAMETGRKARKFNGFISTQNIYHPIINQKRTADVMLLEPFKNRSLQACLI